MAWLSGGLIQTALGSGLGFGGPWTKRSGCSDQARRSVSWRCCRMRCARPWWMSSGVIMAMPAWRCSVLYQAKNDRQKSMAWWMERNRFGKPGWYFRVLNWASEGVVVADAGPAERSGDAQFGEQLRGTLAGDGGAAVGVQREGIGFDALVEAGLFDEMGGQGGGFAFGEHPADDIAAEQIQQDVLECPGDGGHCRASN